ncbi:hypothetical protein V8F06_011777 [Rhypophila decipiens]
MMQAQHSWYRKIKSSNEASSCYVSDEGGLPIVFGSFWIERYGSPLAFALRIDRWLKSPSRLRRDFWPEQFSLIEFVLSSGENPRYVQVSQRPLWSYVINFIHILRGCGDIRRETFVKWLNICKLMVHYGADPYACCLEDFDTFFDPISKFSYSSAADLLNHTMPTVTAFQPRSANSSRYLDDSDEQVGERFAALSLDQPRTLRRTRLSPFSILVPRNRIV